MNGQASPVSELIAEIITGVRDIRYTQLVSFVCIEREVELIWKKRWSVIKFAFLWHRYFGLLCVILQVYGQQPMEPLLQVACSFWFYWETWGYCAVLFTSEAVLLLWIYVVYNKNRWVLAVMGACYVAEVASVLTILAISFENFEASALHFLGVEYCVMGDFPTTFRLLWVPILAYDTLLLLLFLYRGCRSTLGCNRKHSYSHDSLLDMVYRHSLLNFLAIFGTYLACAAIWLTSPLGLYQIPVGFALALSITNCTRLLLNIRRAYYSGAGDPLLFNIRDIPNTGANTPNMLDAPPSSTSLIPLTPPPIPMSPLSATSGLSGETLRERSVTPINTLRLPAPHKRASAHAHALRISIATTSSDMIQVAPRYAHEYERAEEAEGEQGREVPRAVYVTPNLDSEWWQYELREMRADPEIASGEAL
ncbi:uncharacterized protein TRAVEDRAFT_43481 [Trametes versicolor FP-101664 SS1]|uniref:uncharacterized protein n=1 Tax=Trametes versicolor (strain FP-101664) TaxID=717944 RepID=UPI0004623B8D|nr:uncharacterized protein TRAVEDRAFT_43481 [Trametes versicolor FP-101664 SS1]EIW63173.1 hypothetical protein TRAVEDRAFT_43481 [Trametes versicolor FP-101664 SS1]